MIQYYHYVVCIDSLFYGSLYFECVLRFMQSRQSSIKIKRNPFFLRPIYTGINLEGEEMVVQGCVVAHLLRVKTLPEDSHSIGSVFPA